MTERYCVVCDSRSCHHMRAGEPGESIVQVRADKSGSADKCVFCLGADGNHAFGCSKHPAEKKANRRAALEHYAEVAEQAKQDALAAPTAIDLLDKAANHMRDRAKQYDRPEGERSMGRCVTAFNAITGRELTEAEGWLLLQILKDVRQWQRPGYHADSGEDCIAYASLKAEAKQREARHA